MTNLEQKGGDEALKLFKKAIENCKPLLEVKSRRVGGANYQVPIEVLPERRTSLAIRWLVTYGRARGEKGMVDKLTAELLDAANGPWRGDEEKRKTFTAWLKPTRPSPTIAGSSLQDFRF